MLEITLEQRSCECYSNNDLEPVWSSQSVETPFQIHRVFATKLLLLDATSRGRDCCEVR